MPKKGLGKGLGALLPDIEQEQERAEAEVLELKLSDVEPNPEQPRKVFNEEQLIALAESIRENGLIQPIIVAKESDGFYRIISGERRWRACKLAGLETISAIVRDYGDQKSVQVALVENLQREDLNPVEEAEGYQYLMDRFDLTQEEVASKVGKSRSGIANTMRLLSLPDDVLALLEEGAISAGHARAILSVKGETAQKALARKIVAEGLSVRQAEQLAKTPEAKPKKEKKEKKSPELKAVERLVSDALATKVTIADKNNKGKIEIEYYSQEQLTEIIDLIINRKED